MDLTSLYRGAVLSVADAKAVKRLITRNGWRMGVGRFVAGETVDAALPKLAEVQQSGKRVVLDVLGEFVASEAAAREAAASILHAVKTAAAAGIEPYLSVKPTQLGLEIDKELAFELASEVARAVAACGEEAGTAGHLCLDMENSPYTEATLTLFERLHAAGYHSVSTVLQSALHRTPEDLERIASVAPGGQLRLVKGAYRESAEVAMLAQQDVIEAFFELARRALDAGMHLNIATHDATLLERVLSYARLAGLDRGRYEVQMLYGVRIGLQDRLAAAGHSLRVYVPFGSDWYGYFSRRLAERPANLAFVVRGLFG